MSKQQTISPDHLRRLAAGYISHAKFVTNFLAEHEEIAKRLRPFSRPPLCSAEHLVALLRRHYRHVVFSKTRRKPAPDQLWARMERLHQEMQSPEFERRFEQVNVLTPPVSAALERHDVSGAPLERFTQEWRARDGIESVTLVARLRTRIVARIGKAGALGLKMATLSEASQRTGYSQGHILRIAQRGEVETEKDDAGRRRVDLNGLLVYQRNRGRQRKDMSRVRRAT